MQYQGLQGRVHRMLQGWPESRERRNKDLWLVKLLTNKKSWDGHISAFTLEELVDLAKDFNSADRYWRLLTSEHKELRGNDYKDGSRYAQKKQIELGYESGYTENVRKLATL